jgi:menaquinone reductase, multiheme cytochrome c subunit
MFTAKTNQKAKITIWAGLALVGFVSVTSYFGFDNLVTDVGYRPEQPVPFSHKLHAGTLQVKCMYCHTAVEKSRHSTVPATSTCMNCHIAVKAESPKIAKVKESWETGKPIEWRRVHKLPDYVNFNHSRHIRALVDCASCHGEVEKMGVVTQVKPLSMGWCLDCHRNPQENVVPAREISGIFTGLDSYEDVAKKIKNESPSWGEGKWKPVSRTEQNTMAEQKGGCVIEAEGLYQHELYQYKPGQVKVAGLVMPKKLALGPENCGSCHY